MNSQEICQYLSSEIEIKSIKPKYLRSGIFKYLKSHLDLPVQKLLAILNARLEERIDDTGRISKILADYVVKNGTWDQIVELDRLELLNAKTIWRHLFRRGDLDIIREFHEIRPISDHGDIQSCLKAWIPRAIKRDNCDEILAWMAQVGVLENPIHWSTLMTLVKTGDLPLVEKFANHIDQQAVHDMLRNWNFISIEFDIFHYLFSLPQLNKQNLVDFVTNLSSPCISASCFLLDYYLYPERELVLDQITFNQTRHLAAILRSLSPKEYQTGWLKAINQVTVSAENSYQLCRELVLDFMNGKDCGELLIQLISTIPGGWRGEPLGVYRNGKQCYDDEKLMEILLQTSSPDVLFTYALWNRRHHPVRCIKPILANFDASKLVSRWARNDVMYLGLHVSYGKAKLFQKLEELNLSQYLSGPFITEMYLKFFDHENNSHIPGVNFLKRFHQNYREHLTELSNRELGIVLDCLYRAKMSVVLEVERTLFSILDARSPNGQYIHEFSRYIYKKRKCTSSESLLHLTINERYQDRNETLIFQWYHNWPKMRDLLQARSGELVLEEKKHIIFVYGKMMARYSDRVNFKLTPISDIFPDVTLNDILAAMVPDIFYEQVGVIPINITNCFPGEAVVFYGDYCFIQSPYGIDNYPEIMPGLYSVGDDDYDVNVLKFAQRMIGKMLPSHNHKSARK